MELNYLQINQTKLNNYVSGSPDDSDNGLPPGTIVRGTVHQGPVGQQPPETNLPETTVTDEMVASSDADGSQSSDADAIAAMQLNKTSSHASTSIVTLHTAIASTSGATSRTRKRKMSTGPAFDLQLAVKSFQQVSDTLTAFNEAEDKRLDKVFKLKPRRNVKRRS